MLVGLCLLGGIKYISSLTFVGGWMAEDRGIAT